MPPPAASAIVAPGSAGEVVQVVAGPRRTRSALAVAARRAVDDRRTHGAHLVEPDAEPCDHARAEALDHHLRLGREREERRLPARRLQVDLHPARAAPGAVGVERRLDLHALLRRRRTHLDHVRAVVGEDA